MNIELGMHVRDIITGFEGVATGRTDYISGCAQILIVPTVDKDGKLREGAWFDLQRVVPTSAAPRVVLDNSQTPGCDLSPARNV